MAQAKDTSNYQTEYLPHFFPGESLPLMEPMLMLLKNSVKCKYLRLYMDQVSTEKQDQQFSVCTVLHLDLTSTELRLFHEALLWNTWVSTLH